MTKKEAIVLSAFTGVLLCDFDDYQKYVENLFGCTLSTGELLMLKEDIQEKAREDAMKILDNLQEDVHEEEELQPEITDDIGEERDEITEENAGIMAMN